MFECDLQRREPPEGLKSATVFMRWYGVTVLALRFIHGF